MLEIIRQAAFGDAPEKLKHIVRAPGREAASGSLRVLTLNVRHGRGHRRWPWNQRGRQYVRNTRSVASFLREQTADVIGLQEADGPSTWSGSYHHVEHVLDRSGYGEALHGVHYRLESSRFDLRYGTALLSRLALRDPASRAFKARPIDTKGYVVAAVGLDEGEIDIVSLHLDLVHSVRVRQVETLVRGLRRRGRPVVVMGDLNSKGGKEWTAVHRLASALHLHTPQTDHGADATYPAWKPSQRIDWILASPELVFADCRVVAHTVSDHVAVAAELRWRR